MADHSKIEWTDATWTIVQGCDPVSQGCVGCYAVGVLWRLMHHPDPKISGPLQGVVEQYTNASGETILRFTGKLALRADRLDWPLRWRQPKMIFVPSHGDIFHKDVPDSFLDQIFAVMALCPQHTFQVLTKRAERMRAYVSDLTRRNTVELAMEKIRLGTGPMAPKHSIAWPLKNVWLGVSAEDQANADERIPLLLQTPAAKRFVSLEPLLGPMRILGHMMQGIDPGQCLSCGRGHGFTRCPNTGGISHTRTTDGGALRCSDFRRKYFALDWVIVGGESGKKARPMHPDWARSLRDQCKAADVPFFFKQWGEWAPGNWSGSGDPAFFDAFDPSFVTPDMSDHDAWASRVHWFDRNQEPDGPGAIRVGKKAAGRLLDGVEHDGFPLT